MAKKVNGIKVYPKYALGSVVSSILCIVTLGVLFVFTCFPVMSFAYNGNAYALSGLDLVNHFFKTTSLIPDSLGEIRTSVTGIIDSISNSVRFFFKEGSITDSLEVFDIIALSEPTNYVIFWFPMVSDWIFLAISVCYIFIVLLSVFILLKGLINLITGKFPKGAKGLTGSIVFFSMLLCLCIFVVNFCFKNIALEDPAITDLVADKIYMPYIALAGSIVLLIAQKMITSAQISGKLYIPSARKIKKTKEIEE